VSYLLLLHKLRVRAVVYDIIAEDRSAERAVDLLGIDILDFAVQDKIVSFSIQADGSLAAEQNEGKDIAVL